MFYILAHVVIEFSLLECEKVHKLEIISCKYSYIGQWKENPYN